MKFLEIMALLGKGNDKRSQFQCFLVAILLNQGVVSGFKVASNPP